MELGVVYFFYNVYIYVCVVFACFRAGLAYFIQNRSYTDIHMFLSKLGVHVQH